MRDETYGIKLIQKYQPDAVMGPTDLVSAEFCVGSFRATYSKMTQEERNTMRERHWYRDPNIDTWVFCPPFLETKPRNSESEPITEDIAQSTAIPGNNT